MERVYYPVNGLKVMMVFYNLMILAAGLATKNDIAISLALFLNLIGLQFHFTVFEDLRDKHWINRLDLGIGVGTLLFLFGKFFVLTATS